MVRIVLGLVMGVILGMALRNALVEYEMEEGV